MKRIMVVEMMMDIDGVAEVRRYPPVNGVQAAFGIGSAGELMIYYPDQDEVHEVTMNQGEWRTVSWERAAELEAVS